MKITFILLTVISSMSIINGNNNHIEIEAKKYKNNYIDDPGKFGCKPASKFKLQLKFFIAIFNFYQFLEFLPIGYTQMRKVFV